MTVASTLVPLAQSCPTDLGVACQVLAPVESPNATALRRGPSVGDGWPLRPADSPIPALDWPTGAVLLYLAVRVVSSLSLPFVAADRLGGRQGPQARQPEGTEQPAGRCPAEGHGGGDPGDGPAGAAQGFDLGHHRGGRRAGRTIS
jgi:hypothetical protein